MPPEVVRNLGICLVHLSYALGFVANTMYIYNMSAHIIGIEIKSSNDIHDALNMFLNSKSNKKNKH